ncbi:hypothetical protein LTS10_012208 [Elasticomyces elasticus]|nr:hypothetical protein LTS10_012208 [Elasticomyces elasticus]
MSTPTPGLMFATSRPISPTTEAQLNDFYQNEHLPDVLSYGAVKMTKRYKSADPNSKFPYLALYPVDDVNYFTSPAFSKVVEETKISRTFGNKSFYDFLEFEIGSWTKTQTSEGVNPNPPTQSHSHAQSLIPVSMSRSPPPSNEEVVSNANAKAWFHDLHLSNMALPPRYRYGRMTGYAPVNSGGAGDAAEEPEYLALCEYDCPVENLEELAQSSWGRKVVEGCEVVGRRECWGLVEVQGGRERQL